MAQLAQRLFRKPEDAGSNPAFSKFYREHLSTLNNRVQVQLNYFAEAIPDKSNNRINAKITAEQCWRCKVRRSIQNMQKVTAFT